MVDIAYPPIDNDHVSEGCEKFDEPFSPVEEKFMNIIAELEARIEVLERDQRKLKSGMPQIGWE